ncbi:MAG: hypothetical protein ACI835_002208 [Planctomycetota bacterium]
MLRTDVDEKADSDRPTGDEAGAIVMTGSPGATDLPGPTGARWPTDSTGPTGSREPTEPTGSPQASRELPQSIPEHARPKGGPFQSESIGIDSGPGTPSLAGKMWPALVTLILVRLWFVLARADVFFYGEELEKGTAAKALLDGLGLDHHQLAYHYYELGGFFISHLKAAAFLLIGESVLAHKLLAVAWCALIFVAAWKLVARHFGRSAASLFGWLFVFAPASIQKLSLLSLGIHFEACLFLVIVLDRGLRLLLNETRTRDMIVLGLASGFGISFSYQSVLPVGFMGLLLLVARPRLVFSRLGAIGWGSLTFGLLPFLWMYSRVGGAMFDIHGTPLRAEDGAGSIGLMGKLGPFFQSVYFDAPLVNRLAAFAFSALLIAAAVSLLRSRAASSDARAPGRILLAFCMFWMVVYASSDFVVGPVYHYFLWMRFAPMWLVATILLSLWASRGRARRAGALLLAWGAWGAATILASGTPLQLSLGLHDTSSMKGYDYVGYFAKLSRHIEGDSTSRLAPLLGFEESSETLLHADLAAEALRDARVRGHVDRLLQELQALDPDAREAFALGLGSWAMEAGGKSIEGMLAFTGRYPPAIARNLQRGAGRVGFGDIFLLGSLEQELDRLPADLKLDDYLEGVGYRVFRRHVLGPYGGAVYVMKAERSRQRLELRDPSQSKHLLAGFDRALGEHHR